MRSNLARRLFQAAEQQHQRLLNAAAFPHVQPEARQAIRDAVAFQAEEVERCRAELRNAEARENLGMVSHYEDALRAFVSTVDNTGGIVTVTQDGRAAPAADLDWTDLGAAYEKACAALGQEPKREADGPPGGNW